MGWTQLLLWIAVGAGAIALWRAARRPLRLLVNERGILDRRLRVGWIHWDEIEGAYGPTAHDRDGLRLRVRASERLRRRLGRRRPRSAGSIADSAVDLRLDLSGSSISPVELLQEILVHTGGTRGLTSSPES